MCQPEFTTDGPGPDPQHHLGLPLLDPEPPLKAAGPGDGALGSVAGPNGGLTRPHFIHVGLQP